MTHGGQSNENFDAGNCFAVFYWLIVGTTAKWLLVLLVGFYLGVL